MTADRHDAIRSGARSLLELCTQSGRLVATAESCTGGMLAAVLTELPGSSRMLERGFVTYSNRAKIEMLGVPERLIAAHGAVSAEVAAAMAEGALDHAAADLAVAITGVAGPDGGSAVKPVGLVFLAAMRRGHGRARVERRLFEGDRAAIREQAVLDALGLLLAMARM